MPENGFMICLSIGLSFKTSTLQPGKPQIVMEHSTYVVMAQKYPHFFFEPESGD
jgi:hypothetical protein